MVYLFDYPAYSLSGLLLEPRCPDNRGSTVSIINYECVCVQPGCHTGGGERGDIPPLAPISPPLLIMTECPLLGIEITVDLFLATFSGYFSHFPPLLQNPV